MNVLYHKFIENYNGLIKSRYDTIVDIMHESNPSSQESFAATPPHYEQVIEAINAFDVDAILKVIPELYAAAMDQDQSKHPAHPYNILEHSLKSAELVEDSRLKLELLLHDMGKAAPGILTWELNYRDPKLPPVSKYHGHHEASAEMAEPILQRLGLTPEEVKNSVERIRFHDYWYDVLDDPSKAIDVARAFSEQEELEKLFDVQRADLLTHSDDHINNRLRGLAGAQKLIMQAFIDQTSLS